MHLTQLMLLSAVGALAQSLGGDDDSSTATALPTDTSDQIPADAVTISLYGVQTASVTLLASLVTAAPSSTVLSYECAPNQDNCNFNGLPITIINTATYVGEIDLIDDASATTQTLVSCSADSTSVSCVTATNFITDDETSFVGRETSTSSGVIPVATFIVTAAQEQLTAGGSGAASDSSSSTSGASSTTSGSTSSTPSSTASSTIVTTITARNTTIATTGGSSNTIAASTTSKASGTGTATTSASQSAKPSNAAVVEKGMLSAAGAVGAIFAAAVLL